MKPISDIKQNMTISKLLLSLVLLFCVNSAFAATLSSKVDRTQVALNESLRLEVVLNKATNDAIDFSQLTQQFEIINKQRSSRQSIINGQLSASTQWTFILLPREQGELIIPSFQYKGIYSEAITISVDDSHQKSTRSDDVFLDVTVDKNSVYVQEQVLLTLRLYYRISLNSYEATDLELDNAIFEVVRENQFNTRLDNQQFKVLEMVYAVHPQTTGTLTIPSQTWRLKKLSRGFGFSYDDEFLITRSDPLTVDVKPIPEKASAKHWLPSTQLTLEPKWQDSIIQARVGEPLNLELLLSANGLNASQLPEIQLPEAENLTIYKGQSSTSNVASSKGVLGKRTQQFAIIPQKAGTWELPEINFSWWNLNTDQEEVIQVPAQTIVVAASQLEDNAAFFTPEPEDIPAKETVVKTSIFWKLSTLALLLINGVFIYLLFVKKKTASNSPIETKQAVTKPSGSYRKVYKQLEQQISHNDWQGMRVSLIQWGQLGKRSTQSNSLSALQAHYPELAPFIHRINQALYSQGESSQGEEAKGSIDGLITQLQALQQQGKTPAPSQHLKELYR